MSTDKKGAFREVPSENSATIKISKQGMSYGTEGINESGKNLDTIDNINSLHKVSK